MSTPTVTEIAPRPEPTAHDNFIDDLRPLRPGTIQAGTPRGDHRSRY